MLSRSRIVSIALDPRVMPNMLMEEQINGRFTDLDPIQYGRMALQRYRYFECTAQELQAQLSRLVVPLPGLFEMLVDAGVIVRLADGRCSVNLD